MKDLGLFDLTNGFYVKTTPIGDLQTTGIEVLGKRAEILIVVTVFSALILSSHNTSLPQTL